MKQLIILPKQSIANSIFQNYKNLYQPRIYLKNEFISEKIIIKKSPEMEIIFTYQQIPLSWRLLNYNLLNLTTTKYDANGEIIENIKIYTPKINYFDNQNIKIDIKYNIFYNFDTNWKCDERSGYYKICDKYSIECDEKFIYDEFLRCNNGYKFDYYIKNVVDEL